MYAEISTGFQASLIFATVQHLEAHATFPTRRETFDHAHSLNNEQRQRIGPKKMLLERRSHKDNLPLLLSWDSRVVPNSRVLNVISVVRNLRGGAQSRLVSCDDNKLYVLKTHSNPQGPNVLANEALGASLMGALGFAVPQWRALTINLRALRIFPELQMETANGSVLPSCGIHFGSEYLGSSTGRVFDFLPKSWQNRVSNFQQFLPVAIFDIWAGQQDERQCLYRRRSKGRSYDAFFIDNGHLFGGPHWSEWSTRQNRSRASMLDLATINGVETEKVVRAFENQIPPLLDSAIKRIPAEWHSGSLEALHFKLRARLSDLRTLVASAVAARLSSIALAGEVPALE